MNRDRLLRRALLRVAHHRAVRGALVAAAALAVLEIVARQVPMHDLPAPRDDAAGVAATVMITDASRIWRLAPGVQDAYGVRTTHDADGLRVPLDAGPDDAPVVLTLGDSSVYGHGVRDGGTLHDQLRVALAARGVPARVLCGGVPGYSTAQTRVLLEEVGWARRPDLLVVADLWSDTTLDHYADRDLLARGAQVRSPLATALARSAIFRVGRAWIDARLGRPSATKIGWPDASDVGVRRVALPDYQANLVAIADAARARGVGVVFLTLTSPDRLADPTADLGGSAAYVAAQRAVAEAVRAPIVDATAVYAASAEAASALFLDRIHPSGTGHRLLADALADTLVARGWPAERLVPSPAAPLPAIVDPSPDGLRSRHGSVQDLVLGPAAP